MCMSVVGDAVEDVGLGVADYFTAGSLTPALVATLAGQVVGAVAQNQQLNKQNDAAAAGIIEQGNLQKQGEGDVTALNKTVAAETPQQKTQQQLASYQKALQAAAPVQSKDVPEVAGASSAYDKEAGSARASASQYVNAMAQSAATTQGTQLERVQEGQQIGSTASNLGLLSQQSDEQSYLTKLRINSAQANPWLMATSAALKGAGSIMSMGAGGAAGIGLTAAQTASAYGAVDTAAGATAANDAANISAAANNSIANSPANNPWASQAGGY
jgi:hypothetical protein